MKKFACLVLALAMVLSLSISANAADPDKITALNGSTDGHAVTVTTTSADKVYTVLIKWESLAFTYKKTAGKWDPTTHTYDGSAGWVTPTSATITVENHSNAAIAYAATFTDDTNSDPATEEKNGVTATIAADSTTLVSADAAEYRTGTASTLDANYTQAGPTGAITVTVSGEPTADDITVGTIKVTITAAP